MQNSKLKEIERDGNKSTAGKQKIHGTAALLSLLQLADPALPIGGFSHSAALETYVQNGMVNNAATAQTFITQMLQQSIQYNDAVFVSLAYDALMNHDKTAIIDLDTICTAVKLPAEMRQASTKLGMRLMKIFQPLLQHNMVQQYKLAVEKGDAAGHYCVAFGLFAAAMNIDKRDALQGFYYNAAAGMVTNSVKLIPLSQQSGQSILFALQDLIVHLAAKSLQPDLELIGKCCSGFDTSSMQHERLYSRLYMS